MSRRLSKGGAAMAPTDVGRSAPSTSNAARRSSRKSFGTALPSGAAAQQSAAVSAMHLTQMYSTVLKMSAENKISAKNSWQLPLIDHMERIISGDMQAKSTPAQSAANSGVQKLAVKGAAPFFQDAEGGKLLATADAALMNFQRASCTLDASIKIWACRVDDVWSSSYRVLENMSRGGGDDGGAGEEGDGQGGTAEDKENGQGGVATKPKKTKASSLLAAATGSSNSSSATIEKNLSAITSKRIEAGLEIDPLFHKMSGGRAGGHDEGGAGATLMLRLPLQSGCALSFDSSEALDVDAAGAWSGWEYNAEALCAAVAAQAAGGQPASRVVGCLPSSDSTSVRDVLLLAAPSALALGLAWAVAERAGNGPSDPLALPAATFLAALTAPVTCVAPSLSTMYTSLRTLAAAVGDRDVLAALQAGDVGAGEAVPMQPPTAPAHVPAQADGGADAGVDTDAAPPAGAARGWDAVQVIAAQVAGVGAGEEELPSSLSVAQARVGAALGSFLPIQDEQALLPGAGPGDDGWQDSGEQGVDVDYGAGEAWAEGPASEYAAVDLAALQAAGGASGVPSGGAGHWKFRAAAKKAAATAAADAAKAQVGEEEGATGKANGGKGKGGRKGKKAGRVDFTPGAKLSPTLFAKSRMPLSIKGKGASAKDAEQLTAASLSKMNKAGLSAYILSPAAELCHPITLRPLGRAELGCAMTLAGRRSVGLAPRIGAGAAPASAMFFAPASHGPRVLGYGPMPTPTHVQAHVADPDDDMDADGGGGAGYWGAGDVEYDQPEEDVSGAVPVPAPAAPPSLSGEGPALVSRGRVVEQVAVKYETVSKRVDVHALKEDMAALLGLAPGHAQPAAVPSIGQKKLEARLRALCRAGERSFTDASGAGAGRGVDPDAAPLAPHPPRATFSSAIRELAPGLSSQVTVPFYFITLLHLANEHGLALAGSGGSGGAGAGNVPLDNIDISKLVQ